MQSTSEVFDSTIFDTIMHRIAFNAKKLDIIINPVATTLKWWLQRGLTAS